VIQDDVTYSEKTYEIKRKIWRSYSIEYYTNIMAIPDVTPCTFVDGHRLFSTAFIFYLEDKSVTFLQTYCTNYQIIRQ